MSSSSLTPVSTQRPTLGLLTAVACISAAVLGFEVALTRVFAALLRYHFGFLVISIALCGLGLGGYAMHWLRRRQAPSLPLLALLFGIAIDAALTLILRGVFAHIPEAFWVAALVLLVPFAIAGAFLAEVFVLYPQWSGRLYAWDLAGAAAAAVGVIGLLQLSSAINACLALALLAASASALVPWLHGSLSQAEDEPDGPGTARQEALQGGLSFAVVAGLLLLLIGNKQYDWLDIPAMPPRYDKEHQSLSDKNVTQPLFTELGTPGHTSRIIDTRWNAFARTDVVADTADPTSYLIYTNGNVPTNMMHWNGDLSFARYLVNDFPLSDWAFAVAPLGDNGKEPDSKGTTPAAQRRGRVLAIGPGGGLDALLSLGHGAQEFYGAEINPSIVGIMRDYRTYNGGIYDRPDVHVVTAEGRAFVRESAAHGQHYAMIFSALTKTATAGQGMALLESFIHTQDAFADYLKALDADGQLTLVVDNPALIARFFTTAVTVFKAQGLNEKDACRHIALMYDPRPYGPYRFGIVVQQSPFTRPQTALLLDAALKRQLTPIFIPDQSSHDDFGPYAAVAAGGSLDDFIQFFHDNDPPLDISPCSDNRPFVLDLSFIVLPIFKQLAGVTAVLAILLAVISWRDTTQHGSYLASASVPVPRLNVADALNLLYFMMLGIAFMLVEIPLSQKLILPLGYPTLALTVILFSILLGGGAGSWFSQRYEGDKLRSWAVGCALGIAILTILEIPILALLQNAMLTMNLPGRCGVAALLLLPLGFLLGTPFPAGMRLFALRRAEHVPLIWGLNGVASVVGSLCAAMAAKSWGFNSVLALGATAYLGAAVILMAGQPREDEAGLDSISREVTPNGT